MQKESGFTLLELMIVVAIVGILAMVAYPSYQDSVRKTRRTDGQTAIMAIQLAQGNFRGNCRFFAQSLGNANTCGTTAALSTVNAASVSRDGYYNMTIQANSATGNAYTIVATGVGSQTADTGCTAMTLTINAANPNGLKAPAICW